MPFDFRRLVAKYSKPIIVEEETDGFYDHDDGGKWKAQTKTRETSAAIFNLSSQDIRGYAIQYGEGGTFTREDVKIYIHEELTKGAKVTAKGKTYTVASAVEHDGHAHGLRIYIARRAGKRGFAEHDGGEGGSDNHEHNSG